MSEAEGPESYWERWEREPVARAEALGHAVEPDPGGITATSRWTCTRCGQAVLRNGNVIYGGAAKDRCTAPTDPAKD